MSFKIYYKGLNTLMSNLKYNKGLKAFIIFHPLDSRVQLRFKKPLYDLRI